MLTPRQSTARSDRRRPGTAIRAAANAAYDGRVLNQETRRFLLRIAYDGSDFAGWAKQPQQRTVQGVLEAALGTITRCPEDPPQLTVAGRTDAGVHARGQVAHVDLTADQVVALEERRGSETLSAAAQLGGRLNSLLRSSAPDVVVGEVTSVSNAFDARFSALWRRYEYRIADRVSVRDPLLRRATVWVDHELVLDRLNEAAAALIGFHDFAAFCKRRDGATTLRTLQRFAWQRDSNGVAIATVQADAFCHSMVRSLVGSCVAVATGRLTLERLSEVLESATRGSSFVVMPAHGLSLEEVAYPPEEEWATRADQTRAVRAEA